MLTVENLSHLPSINIPDHVTVVIRNTNSLDNATDFQNTYQKLALFCDWSYIGCEFIFLTNLLYHFVTEQFIAPQSYSYLTF